MAYQRNDDDVRRLAEVVFTKRVSAAKVPPSAEKVEALVDAEVFFAFAAAESFSSLAEAWLTEGEGSDDE